MDLKGLNEIFNAFDAVSKELAQARKRAFTRIGLIVKADAVKNAPIDTGNLRGSAFTNVEDDGVSIGFTASYAPFVHEMVDMKTADGRKGPKFLERAVKENEQRIIEELKREQVIR